MQSKQTDKEIKEISQAMVVHTFIPSSQEAEAGISLWVRGQSKC